MPANKEDHEKIIKLLSFLGIDAEQVTISATDDSVHIEVVASEAEAGRFIGRFASVLDSLQLLLSLFLNHGEVHRHVTLDIGGYRKKRLKVLEDMAARLASEATRTHTSLAFPPLSSSERRLIHLMFVDHDTLTTFSQGEGHDRRLFIAPH